MVLILVSIIVGLLSAVVAADCETPLFIKSTVSSSSDLSADFCSTHAQLSSKNAWCPNEKNMTSDEYIQMVFPSLQQISRIRIAGEGSPGVNMTARRVTKYRLMISKDGIQFQPLKEISSAELSLSILARAVRLVPLEFDVSPCLRFEVYGCDAPKQTVCSEFNGGCNQRCVQHEKYCMWGKCFIKCVTDWMCTKYVECRCNSGYRLESDKKTCKDIDECKQGNNGNCDQTCTNEEGSYKCSCRNGFQLASDKHACRDVDECSNNRGGCNQICENTWGSYKCKCSMGYKMKSDQHNCTDINECDTNNGGCSHQCVNFAGSYRCACPKGYQVDSSGKTCVDTNECNLGNGGCESNCHNTNGSYYCSCRSGFQLYDTFKCRDIDECGRNTDQCDPISTACNNYQGGYECRCRQGYQYIPGNKYKCERVACPALVQSQGTVISPPQCMQGNGRKVGDKCTFTCQTGYELPVAGQDTMTCQNTGRWDRSVISCQAVRCPSIPPLANGDIYPPFCKVSGNTFGQRCYYRCNTGFTLSGKPERDCQSSGQWDSPAPSSCKKAHIPPWINCPLDVIVTLAPNANTADVTAVLQKPTSNVKNIKMTPVKYSGNLVFPTGTTILTFTAANENDETASCTTDVVVEDKTAPRVVFCPAHIYKTVPSAPTTVSWRMPEFADNVKVTSVSSNRNPGDPFDIGRVQVSYKAVDAAGNSVQCQFDVFIKRRTCPAPVAPDNGSLTCTKFGTTDWCQIVCQKGKQPFLYTFGSTCTPYTGVWQTIPDCVDFVALPSSGQCPDGKIKQGSATGFPNSVKYCVACPRGYKYDSVSKDCIKCPVGHISAGASSTQCTKCPQGTSTAVPGSKTCAIQCKPGMSSEDGFDPPINANGCSLCQVGYYADTYGATKCTKCPSTLTTIAKGAKSSQDCGTAPVVTEFGPSREVTVDENGRVEFVCKATGPPMPNFKIAKARPTPDGFGGPVKVEAVMSGGKQIGVRYIILRVTEHDDGLYTCTTASSFGTDKGYLNLKVNLIIGSGQGQN